MPSIYRITTRTGLRLALFALVATGLVSLIESLTRDKIIDNERQILLMAINAVVDHKLYNNDILTDTLSLPATKQLGTADSSTIYRARMNGKPVAVILTAIAPNGYSGKIKLLIGINYDGTLTGVRAISHKETPGLGDKIDQTKSNWILQFTGLSLQNPMQSNWQVKKDGGDFDAFTGATITPRAVIAAIKKSLLYFKQYRDQLFAAQGGNLNE